MIVLFTDFGWRGPYVGQLKRVLAELAPDTLIIDLFCDAPAFDPVASGHLLAAYCREFPRDTVFLCVVDPGVGMSDRPPLVINVDGRWFVGPGNGLFDVVAGRGEKVDRYRIVWQPDNLSATFHGRDLFAPIAAFIATDSLAPSFLTSYSAAQIDSPTDGLFRIIYTDNFGNCMTGILASEIDSDTVLYARSATFKYARTFGAVPAGSPFWYENSNALVELAVNKGDVSQMFGLQVGDEVIVKNER